MGIDNSGNSYVFDAGTIQAIEEGKNRISLINAEIERLTRLQVSLNADVTAIHAEIEYSKTTLETLTQKHTQSASEFDALQDKINVLQASSDAITADIAMRTDVIMQREVAARHSQDLLTGRENAVASRETFNKDREAALVARETAVTDSENKIKDFIANL